MSALGRLRCHSIPYRQGFIEVGAVHDGCVNVETWRLSADVDLSRVEWVSDDRLTDDDVTGNTELELTPAEARRVAGLLIEAAERAESTSAK